MVRGSALAVPANSMCKIVPIGYANVAVGDDVVVANAIVEAYVFPVVLAVAEVIMLQR